MISGIEIRNFKSIGEEAIKLELKPLTLLVGPNGSGKSSIIQAIAVAAQQGQAEGPMFNMPTHDVFHQRQDEGTMDIVIRFDQLGKHFINRFAHGNFTGYDQKTMGDPTQVDRKLKNELYSSFFFVSSGRGNVPLEASASRDVDWVGVNGEYLVELLAVIFGQRSYDRIAGQITSWAARFGMTGLKAGFWGKNRLNVDYQDDTLKTALRLALASAGAKQVLTVITQLFWSPPRSIIAIEEPEISLHPKAQIDIAKLFSKIVREDKQIIATTHSSLLVLALGAAVQQRFLDIEDMAIYHVEKKGHIGTLVKRLSLNKQGYLRRWIPSFGKEERRLLRDWLKTVPEE